MKKNVCFSFCFVFIEFPIDSTRPNASARRQAVESLASVLLLDLASNQQDNRAQLTYDRVITNDI